jgi:hypothetical protein
VQAPATSRWVLLYEYDCCPCYNSRLGSLILTLS